MIATIESINLEERLQNGPDRLDGAASSYQTYLKKIRCISECTSL